MGSSCFLVVVVAQIRIDVVECHNQCDGTTAFHPKIRFLEYVLESFNHGRDGTGFERRQLFVFTTGFRWCGLSDR